MNGRPYDVAIVGAGIAGCTAARLYAQHGAHVALIEQRPALDAYKTTCTHFIQPSATTTIRKLGLAPLLDARGAVHNSLELWTAVGGWIELPDGAPHGYSVTRRTLDPILRQLTAETVGVDFMPGETAVGLFGGDRPAGVEIEDRSRRRRRVPARLIVAADGRDSGLARMARVPGRAKPHGRFFYWAYFRDLQLRSGKRSQIWIRDPDVAYAFPNEDELTVVLIAPHKQRLAAFKAGLEGAYMRSLTGLPDGPDWAAAARESKLLGKLDVPNVYRRPAVPGIAFLGDAALACDPLWGVGCGWAFQSADWLVEKTAHAVVNGEDVDGALRGYRRRHQLALWPHHLQISDFATGRCLNSTERLLFRLAAADRAVAASLEWLVARREPPLRRLA